jgi:hypothetical protein
MKLTKTNFQMFQIYYISYIIEKNFLNEKPLFATEFFYNMFTSEINLM